MFRGGHFHFCRFLCFDGTLLHHVHVKSWPPCSNDRLPPSRIINDPSLAGDRARGVSLIEGSKVIQIELIALFLKRPRHEEERCETAEAAAAGVNFVNDGRTVTGNY